MSSTVEVIVVGGAVSGLTFAHCLRKAGISYVVLERRDEVCFAGGASIGLMPHGLRILDQLDLCDQILRLTVPVHSSTSRLSNGQKFRTSRLPEEIEKRHGYPFTFFEREELLKVLFDNIPDKENIQTSQQVTDLEIDEKLITVKTKTGRIWRAPIVVGADGIHSMVRQHIWKELDQGINGTHSLNGSKAIVADYYCIFGMSVYKSDDPDFVEGSSHIINDQFRCAVVISSSRNKHFWFLIEKFDERKSYPNIPRFRETDMENMVAKNSDLMVTEHTSFSDLWRLRTKCAMVPLEEVVFDDWHANRLVLLGDAAHKVTPNAGQGGNSAIESAAVLVNLLHKAKTSHGNLGNMTTAEVTELFENYHSNRKDRVKEMSDTSAFLIRLHAQDNAMLKVVGRHVFPFLGDDFESNAVSNFTIRGATLDFIPVKTKPAMIPWEGWIIPDSFKPREKVFSTFATLVLLAISGGLLSTRMNAQRETHSLSSTASTFSSPKSIRGMDSMDAVLPEFGSDITSLWATVCIVLNTLTMGGIIATESFRIKNLRLLSARVSILCSTFVFCGLGFGGAAYSLLRIVEAALVESKSPSQWTSRVSLKHAKTFNLSLRLALGTALSFMVIPLFWPGLDMRRYVSSSRLLSSLPVMPLLFDLVLSKFAGDQTKSVEVMKAHEDLSYLKKGWLLSGLCAMLAHVGYLVSSVPAGTPIFDFHSAAAVLSQFTISAPSSIEAEYLVFTISTLLWVTCAVIARSKDRRSLMKKLGFFAKLAVSTILFGPGAVTTTLWTLTEDARRSTAMEI